jgi:bacteriocin resistance YdeI/OmpD-like protein/uncharacterized protein DUF1905
MQFRTNLVGSGKTATGIVVPPEVVEALGSSRRPAVRVTIRGYTYRSTVATMSGQFMVGVSAEVRREAGVGAGDEVDVVLELDTQERTVEVPPDFAAALAADPAAKTFFDGLSYSQQRWFVLGIEEAKKPETRLRRVEAAVSRLREGRGQR